MKMCLICEDEAVAEKYGNSFCEKHKKYLAIDPEDLETIVIYRFMGVPVPDIEKELDEILNWRVEG